METKNLEFFVSKKKRVFNKSTQDVIFGPYLENERYENQTFECFIHIFFIVYWANGLCKQSFEYEYGKGAKAI
jgi:hypothetical protein